MKNILLATSQESNNFFKYSVKKTYKYIFIIYSHSFPLSITFFVYSLGASRGFVHCSVLYNT